MTYTAPLADMRFVLDEMAGLPEIAALPGCEQAAPDLVDAVLDEAGKLARDVLAPLNAVGDRERRACWRTASCARPPGFATPIARYVEGGWNALPFEPEHGGQGLPLALATAVLEMWNSANMGFALCPMLTRRRDRAAAGHGSAEQKRLYLAKLVSGEWTGTMNLTEPQAGSDVGALRTRAVHGRRPLPDHRAEDLHHLRRPRLDADNIVHLVLARTPDAPPGTRASRCSSCRNSCVDADGTPRRAQRRPLASASSTSSASMPARPASWPSATAAAPSAS